MYTLSHVMWYKLIISTQVMFTFSFCDTVSVTWSDKNVVSGPKNVNDSENIEIVILRVV